MDSDKTEKTETETRTPEGTTAEQVAVAEAALAVLPADEEPSTEGLTKEKDKLIGDVTGLRSQKRRLKAEIASETTRREAPVVEKPPEPSPLDKFVAEHPGDVVPGEVSQAERDFQDEKRKTATEQRKRETAASEGKTRTDAALQRAKGKYSDFEEVTEIAEQFLTEGEILDIRKESQPEDLLYKKSIAHILEHGGEEAARLKARLRAVTGKKVETESASEEKETKPGGSKTTPKPASAHIERMRAMLG